MVQAIPRKTGKPLRQWQPCWISGVGDLWNVEGGYLATVGAGFEVAIWQKEQLGSSSGARSTSVDDVHGGASGAGHDCIVCVYVNGTYANKGKNPDSGAWVSAAYAPSLIPGSPYLVDGGLTWLMDPRHYAWKYASDSGNPSVPDIAEDSRATKFGSPNADGVMVDSLGWGVVQSGYNSRATGANPPTVGATLAAPNPRGGNWMDAENKAEWVRYTGSLAGFASGNDVNKSAPIGREGGVPIAVYQNGESQGTRYFDLDGPTWQLLRWSHGGVFESWLRSPTAGIATFDGVGDWRDDVDAIIDTQALGKLAFTWTKVWATHTHTDDKIVTSVDTATDRLTIVAHGLASNDKVGFNSSSTAPGGISTGSTIYWVIIVDANTIQVSATSGPGGAVNLTSAGVSVKVRKVVSQNTDDDGDNTDIVRWHRFALASYLMATDGRALFFFHHDYPDGTQRVLVDRWTTHVNSMGWPSESFRVGIGVWATANAGTDKFTANAHGFAEAQEVVVDADVMPGGLTARTVYYAKTVTTNDFKLAATSGGAAIDITSTGSNVRVRKNSGFAAGGVYAAKQAGLASNLYVRHFANGLVIVNPTGAGSNNTYTLPAGTWRDVDGTDYTGSVTLVTSPRDRAMILVKQ